MRFRTIWVMRSSSWLSPCRTSFFTGSSLTSTWAHVMWITDNRFLAPANRPPHSDSSVPPPTV
jgi:hypothetical protein